MARRAAKKSRRSHRRRRKGDPTGNKHKVKGHTRSPRGPNAGKKPVYVRSYQRRPPRRKR